MSRLFSGAGHLLQISTAVVTSYPSSACAWAKSSDLTLDQGLLWCGDVADNKEFACKISMEGAGTIPIADYCAAKVRSNADGGAEAKTSIAYTANNWHHIAGVFPSISSRSAYLDGGSKGTNTDTVTPVGVDTTDIGGEDGAGSMIGDIAHVAVWNIALTDQEVASLAAGVSPLRMRRSALVAYWPINGVSPEVDIIGGLDMTVTGTSVSAEPPNPGSIVAP